MDPGPSSPQPRRQESSGQQPSGYRTPSRHVGVSQSQGFSRASSMFRAASSDRSRRLGRGELFTPSTARKFIRQGQSAQEALFDDDEMIFGTKIKTRDVRDRFRDFLDRFDLDRDRDPDEMDLSLSYYMKLLKETAQYGTFHFCVDLTHVLSFDKMLYTYIVNFPLHVIPLVDKQLTTIAEMELDVENAQPVEFRPFNLQHIKSIRELDTDDMYRLISVEGMITRTSSIIPQIKMACFQCRECQAICEVTTDMNRVKEPSVCEKCQAKWSFVMKHTWSIFGSRQMITMQESPNHIPEGETPHTIVINAHDAMVEKCRPGDRVRITGLFCSEMKRVNPIKRTVESVCKPYVDLLHVDIIMETAYLQKPVEEPAKTAEEEIDIEHEAALLRGLTLNQTMAKETEMKMMGNDPNIYEKLVASLAPSVWEMEDVKKGLLCQLFGGTDAEAMGVAEKGSGHIRSDINILLVGDPGVSKSQLLMYVHKLSTRGLYTSGKGSSAVGLTAYISKDPETKEIVLESGALVLSDRGICCIDEFDKMSQSARSTLHEVMEQQTCSVAKAGIVSTLNARVSVLASANPVGSKYNPEMTVVENIQLPPSLISRFDMIFLILDIPYELRDQRLAKHLISLVSDAETAAQQVPIPKEKMREYIAFAKQTCHPKLTKESAKLCVQQYVQMRQEGKQSNTVTATTRQLESFMRISESLAKMELSPIVQAKHVEEGVRLVKAALRSSFIDKTGRMDLEQMFTGVTQEERQLRQSLVGEIQRIIRAAKNMPFMKLHEKLNTQSSSSISQQSVREVLSSMADEILVRKDGVVTIRE